MNPLPDSLSRKSITATFTKLSAVAWEKLFERENQNCIAKLRVAGDMNNKVYYRTEGIVHWLVRNGYYTVEEMNEKFFGVTSTAPSVTIRRHVMAG